MTSTPLRRDGQATFISPYTPQLPHKPNMPVLDTKTLFAASSEVTIEHESETYRLRLTRQNKLILTK